MIHLPNITHPQSIERNLQPNFIANHHEFTTCKNLYQWPQQTSKRWTIDTPPYHESRPIQRCDSRSTQLPTPHKSECKKRYHFITTTLDLGHPAVKHRFCQRYIRLIKVPKARATGRQSMDHTCNMIQMIETMKASFGQ
jgi:hypothetical protein